MKYCEDYAYTGAECCPGCHYENEEADVWCSLITIQIDGEMAYVCCAMANFFYPDGDWKDKSPTAWQSKS